MEDEDVRILMRFTCGISITDPERNYIYIAIFNKVCSSEYATYDMDPEGIMLFKNKVEGWMGKGIVPGDAKFGIHTYY